MTEIYIRSQDKEKLYRLGGYACIEYHGHEYAKDRQRHTVCFFDGGLEEAGEYGSRERCIEILDEIQKKCEQYSFAPGGDLLMVDESRLVKAPVIPVVYQMPEK